MEEIYNGFILRGLISEFGPVQRLLLFILEFALIYVVLVSCFPRAWSAAISDPTSTIMRKSCREFRLHFH